MMRIRLVESADLGALYAISLATGFAGGDARHLYEDGKLLGHIYSAPYACLEPELALVVEDNDGVGGFAVGATDTIAWEARLEREWWPPLRQRYPDPPGEPGRWTADQRRCAMLHRPERTPLAIALAFPGHLHLNLLPRLQRRGLGSRLFRAWLELAAGYGARAVHVGVNHRNGRALQFWSRQGFEGLTQAEEGARTTWMGRYMIQSL